MFLQIVSNQTDNMVLIVLRHGSSQWNQENRFTGWTDIGLSIEGNMEAEIAGYILNDYKFDFVYTSDLMRTIDTAKIIIKENTTRDYNEPGPPVVQAVELKERDYGNLTGKNKAELTAEFGQVQMNGWRRSYYEYPPNGENLHDVVMRAGQYFDTFIRPQLEAGKNVLIVSHGNTLRALFVHLGLKTRKTIETFEIATGVPIQIDGQNKTFSYENEYELAAYQILDSRGYPTIEVKCLARHTKRSLGRGSSPSGASCGSNEVLEMRDGIVGLYNGKSVYNAIGQVAKINQQMILNSWTIGDLIECDKQLKAIDGTDNKSNLGGNTTTAVSFCLADVGAHSKGLELYQYISQIYGTEIIQKSLPTPMVNIINGGKHSVTGDLKIQEFMIFPNENMPALTQNRIVCEVYYALKKILANKYGHGATSIGDEGGFCPPIYTCEEALQVIEEAIVAANYIVGQDVFLALDCAASEYYNEETKMYEVEKGMFLTGDQLIEYYSAIMAKHPALKSIEDGFHETDYTSWTKFTALHRDNIMIVGDDLFTTNSALITRGLSEKWANTLLLKVNQIGTISEAVESAKLMFAEGNNVIVSHRSGETNHAYIVDIAVGIGAKYLKIGSPCRGERVAKFNRLLELDFFGANFEK